MPLLRFNIVGRELALGKFVCSSRTVNRKLSTQVPNQGIDYELWPSPDERDFFFEYEKYSKTRNAFIRPFKWMAINAELSKYSYNIYAECFSRFGQNESFVKVCKLPYEISPWYAFGLLHVWMYSLRLRGMGRTGKDSYQQIHTYIFDTIRMRIHFSKVKVVARPLLIRLMAQFYGSVLSFNEGLDLGDKHLASALVKNLLSYGYYDMMIVEHLVNYTYTELKRLDEATYFDIIKGNFRFKEIGVPEWHAEQLLNSSK